MTNVRQFNTLSASDRQRLRFMIEQHPGLAQDALNVYDVVLHGRTACASQVALNLGLDVERAATALRFLEKAGAVRRDSEAADAYDLPVFSVP